MRAGEAADARADNGDALAALDRRGSFLRAGSWPDAQVVAIGGVALQRADGDWLVDLAAPAVVFAGMRADAAQHIGEGIGRARQKIRFFILARSRSPARSARTPYGSDRQCGREYSCRNTPGPGR